MGKIRVDVECPKCSHVNFNRDIEYGKVHTWNCSSCNCEVQFYVNCYDENADKHGEV